MLLSFENVSLTIGTSGILADVDMTVAPGESVCLVGPSGCGKTSLLRLAAGVVEASSGTVNNRFGATGVVFQDPRLLPWHRTLENIALGLKSRGVGRRERLARARALASKVGLEDSHDCFPHELSGGMQQRVALARALAIEADILLLDEPFSALDVGLRAEGQDLVERLVVDQGMSALIVTHDLTEALRLAHRVVVVSGHPGRVVFEHCVGTPFHQRSPAWLYEQAGHLLRQEVVRKSFLFQRTSERMS